MANVQEKKKLFLLTLESRDTVTETVDLLKMARSLPYMWERDDEEFAKEFKRLREEKKMELSDLAKKSLKQKLIEGDPNMIKFTLNCLDRDFREKVDQSYTGEQVSRVYQIFRGEELSPEDEKNDSTNSQDQCIQPAQQTEGDNQPQS